VKIIFSEQAWDDYLYWQKTDKKMLNHINQLIKEIQRQPFEGIGKPWGDEKEVLKALKLDPLNIPLQFYYFKNLKLTIISLRSLLRFFNLLIINH
jgi:Txe/YoeB family toxin of toxin-antitoxin system